MANIKGKKISEFSEVANAELDSLILLTKEGINNIVTFNNLLKQISDKIISTNISSTSPDEAASMKFFNNLNKTLNEALIKINENINNIKLDIADIEDRDIRADWDETNPYSDKYIENKPALGKDGKSAYQIAVKNGFVGTEEEWLESLRGQDGKNGTNGEPGRDGTSTYFHMRWSVNSNGNPMQSTPAEYVGTVVTTSSIPPSDYREYKWFNWKGIQGEDGTQGIPGINGEDGKTSFLHIKYGIGFGSDGVMIFSGNGGEDPAPWLGQYVSFDLYDSTDPNKYTWSLIQGEKGQDGAQGQDGKSYEYIFKLTTDMTRPSTPSSAQVDDFIPTGWTDDMTGVSASYQYEWACIRTKTNGIWSNFSEPALWARFSKDGQNGKDGDNGGIATYMGIYDPNTTYVGSSKLRNIVKWNDGNNDYYYMTLQSAGEFSGIEPSNSLYWEAFTQNFRNIATEFLFAEGANIGGWIFHKNNNNEDELISQNGSSILNGTTGNVEFQSGNIGGWIVSNNEISSPYNNNGDRFVLDSKNSRIYMNTNLLPNPTFLDFMNGSLVTDQGVERGVFCGVEVSPNDSSENWYRTKLTQNGLFTKYNSGSGNILYYQNDINYYGFDIKRINNNYDVVARFEVNTRSNIPESDNYINIRIQGLRSTPRDIDPIGTMYVTSDGTLKLKMS